jgi:hypothetical protein
MKKYLKSDFIIFFKLLASFDRIKMKSKVSKAKTSSSIQTHKTREIKKIYVEGKVNVNGPTHNVYRISNVDDSISAYLLTLEDVP